GSGTPTGGRPRGKPPQIRRDGTSASVGDVVGQMRAGLDRPLKSGKLEGLPRWDLVTGFWWVCVSGELNSVLKASAYFFPRAVGLLSWTCVVRVGGFVVRIPLGMCLPPLWVGGFAWV